MTRSNALAALLVVSAAFAATGALAQRANVMPNVNAALDRLYLGCTVDRGQELIITNTTPAAIADGTAIWFNVKVAGRPDETAYIYRALPAGASFGIPDRPADSCTAWLRVTPMMAPD